jgi:sorbitol-specific phosphotransferase system component IIA
VFPLKVSGTTVVADTPTDFAGATAVYPAISFDSNVNKNLIAFGDAGNSEYGTAVSFAPLSGNLTSENYIGMSRGVAFQTGSADSVGSETEFINQMGNEISAAVYDPDSSKVILAYSDQDNSVRGTAIVGTVSGTSISFGTPAVYNTSETTHIGITYDTTNDKVVIVYRDGAGNNNYGNAIVGTVSGTSISFGTAVVYNTATSHNNSAVFDSNTGKVVIAFRDNSNNNVTSRVGTVSGTSISFGTAVQVDANGNYVAAVFDSNTNKVVVIYRDGNNSNYGTARVGTVSGTDISFGTEAVFNSGATEDIHCAFDSSNNKVVIAYKDGGDSDKGNCVVGTVSGTSISFGSEATFHNASTGGVNGIVYNSNQNKVFFFYTSGSSIGRVVSGTVSGTTVGSFGSEFTYHNASTNSPFQVYDVASTNIVAAYRDGGDSNKGKAVVFKPDNIATTRGQVTNGQAASVDVIGSVSSNQIGLTAGEQYFVQNDGTISTTADSPSVLAGTAISANS